MEMGEASREQPAALALDEEGGASVSGGAGAANSPPAPTAKSAKGPTVGDDLDSMLARGPESAEKVHRLADKARAAGDCTEALRLYRAILRDYPKYSGRADVERGIRACQAAKEQTGTQK